MPTRKYPSFRSEPPPSIAQIHPIQSPFHIPPRNYNNSLPWSRSRHHHLTGCTTYAARRGVISRMGALARPVWASHTSTTIHLPPPRPVRHLACRRRLCSYPLRAITTTDPGFLAPNTANADGTYEEVCLPLGWQEWRILDGRSYIVNHHTRTTTWNDPRRSSPFASAASTNALANRAALGPPPSGWEIRVAYILRPPQHAHEYMKRSVIAVDG